MIAICIAKQPRIHLADVEFVEVENLPPEVKAALPKWLKNIGDERERRDKTEQAQQIQAAAVHRDDVRWAAGLLVLNVALAAINAWMIGVIWARFG